MIKKTFFVKFSSLIIITLVSCKTAIKPQVKNHKSGKNLYETFFVGEEGTQYFIKPITLKNDNESLVFDSIFRYKKDIEASKPVDLKFSILSSDFVKDIDSFIITNGSKTIEINKEQIELLFNDKTKNGYISRFTAKLSLIDFKELHKTNSWEITVNQRRPYTTSIKTKKNISILNQAIFVIL